MPTKTALVDADVLRYEIGHSAQYKDEETGEEIVREFDFAVELLEQKLIVIKEATGATEVVLYLTNDVATNKIYNRWRKTNGLKPIQLVPNFRIELATVKEYKGNRYTEKPVHYNNLTAYMIGEHECVVANGVEADDLMAMRQDENTIICSRDKDLRQVPGLHYSWECGKQVEIGPIKFDKKGFIEKKDDGKVFGGGELFFMYQLLVGDGVDNIAGCPKVGPVKALKILDPSLSRKDLYMAILASYREIYGENALTYLTENARLLWLLREPEQIWEFPYETDD